MTLAERYDADPPGATHLYRSPPTQYHYAATYGERNSEY